jgi:hypothetical protein
MLQIMTLRLILSVDFIVLRRSVSVLECCRTWAILWWKQRVPCLSTVFHHTSAAARVSELILLLRWHEGSCDRSLGHVEQE